ncbi:hypothetical protein N9E09_00705 [bacterium]|jgi:hypothetical protein|nr:hypothetical protein [bacterium]
MPRMKLVKSLTIKNVKLPYTVVVIYDGTSDMILRNELVSRYESRDFSCHIDKYISTATINFRNEIDAADFLMRL